MSGVYSIRLALGTTEVGTTLTYVVPEGNVAILTDVDGFVLAAGAWSLAFGPDLEGGNLFGGDGSSTDQSRGQWRGRMVCGYGDTLVFAALEGTVYMQASGYLLSA